MKFVLYSIMLFSCTVLASCSDKVNQKLHLGIYRATMEVRDGKSLPFNFEIGDDGMMQIFNGEEVLNTEGIVYIHDSKKITFPVYEGYNSDQFKMESHQN